MTDSANRVKLLQEVSKSVRYSVSILKELGYSEQEVALLTAEMVKTYYQPKA